MCSGHSGARVVDACRWEEPASFLVFRLQKRPVWSPHLPHPHQLSPSPCLLQPVVPRSVVLAAERAGERAACLGCGWCRGQGLLAVGLTLRATWQQTGFGSTLIPKEWPGLHRHLHPRERVCHINSLANGCRPALRITPRPD